MLFVQSARDVAIVSSEVADSVDKRSALNAARAAKAREVATALRPDLDVQVTVLDVPSVGMSGREAQTGVPKLYAAPEGQLSRDAVLGAAIGSAVGGAGGGGGAGVAAPTPAVADTPPAPPSAAPGGLNRAANGRRRWR